MWLDELRKKPKAVRDQYAFAGAFFITLIIATFWFLGLGVKWQTSDEVIIEEEPASKSAFGTFYREIKTKLGDAITSLKTDVDELREIDETETATSSDSSSEISTSTDIVIQSSSTEPEKEGKLILIGTTSQSISTTSNTE